MATAAGVSGTAADTKKQVAKKLVDNLQADLRALSNEAKRKYPPVKEAAESGIIRVRTAAAKTDDIISALQNSSSEIIQPLVLGCDTKNPRIVQICLGCIQRLITHEALSVTSATGVVNMLWRLMEGGMEELKLLQTVIILLTTNSIVKGETLAKALVMCFRLHFTKDSTTINTASATVRQLVTMVFERAEAEDKLPLPDNVPKLNLDCLKTPSNRPPVSLQPCAADAFLLFQDLCQLVNADQPQWLIGMTEMTRTFGLELIESVLTRFSNCFVKHPEFSFLLKERVCPLVIKLFSPNIKHRQGMAVPAPLGMAEKPYFPISVRLLRIVCILIQQYYNLLVTECEIFLSLLVRFLDPDKPSWQRALAVEVLHKLTVRPGLLQCFCQCYDMKPHSTKVFRDIVNAVGAFIQSQFVQASSSAAASSVTNSTLTTGQPPALVAGLPVGPGVTPQPAFIYRGVWLPVTATFTPGATKSVYLEVLDKAEPPCVADGYGVSVAYACMMEIVRSAEAIVMDEVKPPLQTQTETDEDNHSALKAEVINSSWCGVLAALSLLLDASTDETATENILKSMQNYASLCGTLGMTTPRDAFITSLCKASLPPHYTLTILNPQGGTGSPQAKPKPPGFLLDRGHSRTNSQDLAVAMNNTYQGEGDTSNQVVVVGTPLPTASLPIGAQQGPVMLTAKNLQSMRAILSIAHCHGGVLGTAWHIVLTTLQHLVWILGLKPSSGGSLKAAKTVEGANAVLTTAVMADLPVLSAMLSRLFESSQYLDDVALHHLIDALCKLSAEAMELAYSNRDPSLFAVAKLLETGLVNLPRVAVLWRPVTNHLLEVCHHPHFKMREWGGEAVTSLIKASLQHQHQGPLVENFKLQKMLLQPLEELSSVPHPDIRQKQLECVLQIVQHNGELLGQGWPLILRVIGAVSADQGETLIRTAFQSLELVVTDFLTVMPYTCLQDLIEVTATFGSQSQELNISLTAVGLLWNISDFLYQNCDKIKTSLVNNMADSGDRRDNKVHMPPFDALWMCLFTKLGDLCVDSRPAVRKSSGQTLFSTIAAHGALLQQTTWQAVLWQVLFPLLDRVKKESGAASAERNDTSGGVNILIHHSRDTAEKQWAETRVLTLAGVARVFSTKRHILMMLGDFSRAWALLLKFIEISAMSRNAEISLSALKSFQEILQVNKEEAGDKEGLVNGEVELSATDDAMLWTNAWKVWYNIGISSTSPPESVAPHVLLHMPSQPYLTTLVQIVPVLFEHIKSRFVAADVQKLVTVLQNSVSVPVHGDVCPFILPTTYDSTLTPLQEAVLSVCDTLHREVIDGSENLQAMYPDMFNQLLKFVEFGVEPPQYGKVDTKTNTAKNSSSACWVTINCVPFAEKSLEMVVALYRHAASQPAVIQSHVAENIMKTLRLPLSKKYDCPSQTTWKLAVNSLLAVLDVALPIARLPEAAPHFHGMWKELTVTLEHFLFTQSQAPPTMTVEEYQRDETIDCKVIQMIREEILPASSYMPAEFTASIMSLLNRGSIHSATSSNFINTESSCKLREEFAKVCFSTLLQFSFVKRNLRDGQQVGSITKLAVSSLLDRCQNVVTKYVKDESLSGKCPLPRTQANEMIFVLKAVSTLLVSLKEAPAENVEDSIWRDVISLYPSLVTCVTSSSPAVCLALRDALQEYSTLLRPPSSAKSSK